MVGEAQTSNPNPHEPHNSSLQTRRRSGVATPEDFPEGTEIEVRTDEEGFKFVYFSAKVISPAALAKSKSLVKKRGRKKSLKKSGRGNSIYLDVEYHDLLANSKGRDRLKETVDISFVRPKPPSLETGKGFEPGDVVDAFYKDGWWQGIVSEVVVGGDRCVVSFREPPDLQVCEFKHVRYHWDWINGSWIRPPRQDMSGLMFEVGRKVEVSFDREDSQDAWFPATINDDLGNGIFRVEYTNKNGEAVQTTVDSHHVRPCPPLLKDKNFVLLEKVDAFFDYCWWSGVITKELENAQYIVFFKPMKQDREINQSKLRPHMEFKEGKWFTSSQEASVQPQDDGVRDHHLSENASAMVATASVKNAVNGNDKYDGKTLSSLTSTKDQVELLTPDNQKMPHANTSLKKRRRYLTDSGATQSLPPKKPKEGNVAVTKPQDKKDGNGQDKEVLCGFLSPDSASNADTSAMQTTEEHPSFDRSWEKTILRKQRNVRPKQSPSAIITPAPCSMTNNKTIFGSASLDIRGEALGAAENYLEDVQNEHANEELEVPIIIGLPCFEAGTPGVSGGRKGHGFKIKDVATIVNDQEPPLISSSILKDNVQSGSRETGERRKRGRPKRTPIEIPQTKEKTAVASSQAKERTPVESSQAKERTPVEGTQTPVLGNAQNGTVASFDLNKKDDSEISPEVEVIETEPVSNQKIDGYKEKVAEGLPYPKNKRVRTMKRTSPSVHKEKGTKESVEVGENPLPKKRGRKMTTVPVQVEDSLEASGGAMMEVDCTVEVQGGVEVQNTKFDNEPLSKWIVELNSPVLIDSSRRSPDSDQYMVNGEKQSDGVVIDEGGEEQQESGKQPSASGAKELMVASEAQSLVVVENPVGGDDDSNESQPENNENREALALAADEGFAERNDLPFVKTISLWKTIETMEVFKKIPQNPHFHPLRQVEESSYREGLALGLMVTFASLVDTTSKLQVSDTKSTVNDMIKTINKLEEHGFDVEVFKDHISEFIDLKDKEEKLIDEVNHLKNTIAQRSQENTRIEEKIREVNEQMRKLQEEHSDAISSKGKIAEELATMTDVLEKTEESIEHLRRNFKGAISEIMP